MSTHSLSLLAMTETHIQPNDNDNLLCSITPVGFKLCHRPRAYGLGSGVYFFGNQNIQFKIFDGPIYKIFKNIIAIGSFVRPFVKTCVYRPPGSCSDSFFDKFLILFEYLSSVNTSFLSVVISIFMLMHLPVIVLNF